MGTDYYELEKPITYLRCKKRGGHWIIDIWINRGQSGTLTVRTEELNDVLTLFKSEKVIYHTFYGGLEKGKITQRLKKTDNLVLFSESNKIVSRAELDKGIENDK